MLEKSRFCPTRRHEAVVALRKALALLDSLGLEIQAAFVSHALESMGEQISPMAADAEEPAKSH